MKGRKSHGLKALIEKHRGSKGRKKSGHRKGKGRKAGKRKSAI